MRSHERRRGRGLRNLAQALSRQLDGGMVLYRPDRGRGQGVLGQGRRRHATLVLQRARRSVWQDWDAGHALSAVQVVGDRGQLMARVVGQQVVGQRPAAAADRQKASRGTTDFGYVPEIAIFGSADWWAAVEDGRIERHMIEGVISRLYMTGHGDWPEVESSLEIELPLGPDWETTAPINQASQSASSTLSCGSRSPRRQGQLNGF